MIYELHTNPPTEHRPVLPIVKRDIPPGFRHYQKVPANHASEMCGGSGRQRRKNFLMFKGRTEVTTRKWEDYEKKRPQKCGLVLFFLRLFFVSVFGIFRLCRKNIFSTSFVDFFCNLSILRKKGVILMKVKYIFLIMLLLILAVCLTACASYNTPDKDWPTYDSMSTAVNISFF